MDDNRISGRTTVRISEAFNFLNDPQYAGTNGTNGTNGSEPPIQVRKSVSDTSLFQNKLIPKHIDSVSSNTLNLSKGSVEDPYTIITYIDPQSTKNIHPTAIISDNLDTNHTYNDQSESDKFTIHTFVETDDTNNSRRSSYSDTNQSSGSCRSKGSINTSLNNYNVADNNMRSDNNLQHPPSEIDSEKNIKLQDLDTKAKLEHDEVILRNQNEHGNSNRDTDLEERVSLRPTSNHSVLGKSRRTQQIVSEAFGFLKSIDDDDNDDDIIDELNTLHISGDDSGLNLSLTDTTNDINNSTLNTSNDTDIDMKRQSLTRSEAFDKNESGIDLNIEPSIQRHIETLDNSGGSVSSHSSSEGTTLRRKKHKHLQEAADKDDISECSSEEDVGIYNESYRNSCWVQVADGDHASLMQNKGLMSFDQGTSLDEGCGGTEIMSDITETDESNPQDDVFVEDTEAKRLYHKRSDSTTTTQSESEFKKSYNAKRNILVGRSKSQQEYQRMSMKVYDHEKLVVIERPAGSTDLGLHILDSHPAVITTVDKDSPAAKAGVKEGQILLSVNSYNVLQSSHAEIVDRVLKSGERVILEVANSDFNHVRDLQSHVMSGYIYKLSGNVFLKNWRRRYFVLRKDNCLYYYKNEQDDTDPLGAVPLVNYTVSKHSDGSKEHCFKAEKYGARTYYFSVETRDQMARWVSVMNEAAMRSKKRKDSWMDVTSHNVGLPALEIRKTECSGMLFKSNKSGRNWRKRYCVLKDACIYYYKGMNSPAAQGMAHLHGYEVDGKGLANKKLSFILNPPETQMRTFQFCAENETDKRRWIKAMEKSIQRWIKVD